jgi:hypothetical protein
MTAASDTYLLSLIFHQHPEPLNVQAIQPRTLLPFVSIMLFTAVLSGLMISISSQAASERLPQLTSAEADWIGQRIFANECNLKLSCLSSWNAGEDFPSLGIGHFIWYRENQQEVFVESFPALLAFYQQGQTAVPDWLSALKDSASPWQNRAEFEADFNSARMIELREFLAETMPIQVEFIINRLYSSLSGLRRASTFPDQIEQLFYAVAHSAGPAGMYVLIDYVNFKGEGTAESERYQGQGWGLLQVLEHMHFNADDRAPLHQFADSAKFVLARRVANAPAERNEARWTQGWNKRIDTYTSAISASATE